MGTAGPGELCMGWNRNEGLHGKERPRVCLQQDTAQAQTGSRRRTGKEMLQGAECLCPTVGEIYPGG